jgi:hypothetical protein
MNLTAVIELMPSFHGSHVWSIALSDNHGEVRARYFDQVSLWRLSEFDFSGLPAEVRSGCFPDNIPWQIGLDGITVRFSIASDAVRQEQEIWSPSYSSCPEHAALLHWCWSGLHEHSCDSYRVLLERLYGYFHDWGIPVFRTTRGLRIFAGLSSGREPELVRYFDEVATMPAPEIDMCNFEGTGTILYPIFKKFFDRAPGSLWRVNSAARRQMKEAGIPETSMMQDLASESIF